jgi:hypothetical protein
MSIRLYTDQISEEQCIGDSLDTINDNFLELDNAVQTLSGQFIVAHTCEINGPGSVDNVMSYGDGATDHFGLQMLYNGQLIAATLQCKGLAGQFGVDALLNNTPRPNYRLISNSISDGANSGPRLIFSTPLNFNAGDTLGWIQISAPSSGVFNVNYLVRYFL